MAKPLPVKTKKKGTIAGSFLGGVGWVVREAAVAASARSKREIPMSTVNKKYGKT